MCACISDTESNDGTKGRHVKLKVSIKHWAGRGVNRLSVADWMKDILGGWLGGGLCCGRGQRYCDVMVSICSI